MCGIGKLSCHSKTINVLPDHVLLQIFDFYRWNHDPDHYWPSFVLWKWHTLVYVCQRWRHITFASPLCLNLCVLCTYSTPVRKSIDIWPNFPIVIGYSAYRRPGGLAPIDEGNVIAALEHTSCVCEIWLRSATGAQLSRIAVVIQEPSPALTHFILQSKDRNVPVVPSQFLGQSVPCLQELSLDAIPFPALLILLLSASNLIALKLYNIPQTGYILPEAMVAGLATLTRAQTSSHWISIAKLLP